MEDGKRRWKSIVKKLARVLVQNIFITKYMLSILWFTFFKWSCNENNVVKICKIEIIFLTFCLESYPKIPTNQYPNLIFSTFSHLCDFWLYFLIFLLGSATRQVRLTDTAWTACLQRVTREAPAKLIQAEKENLSWFWYGLSSLECQIGAGCKMETNFHFKIGKIKIVTIFLLPFPQISAVVIWAEELSSWENVFKGSLQM